MTLKLEVGKTYVDGYDDKVTVASIIDGYCLCEDDRGFYWFTTDGKALSPANERPETSDINSDDGCHLVAEYKEPVVHEWFVGVYETSLCELDVTKLYKTKAEVHHEIKMQSGWLRSVEKITFKERQDVSPATYEEK